MFIRVLTNVKIHTKGLTCKKKQTLIVYKIRRNAKRNATVFFLHSSPRILLQNIDCSQSSGTEKINWLAVCICRQFMPIVVVMFAMGAAMGQFGCYWYDGALRLSFSKLSNDTGVEIPAEIDVLFNILRATSLFHIFYGFCLLLVFHLSLIFMIQSSMHEFNGEIFNLRA